MMASPYNSKSFKKLKEMWDKKLALSGFKDCEITDVKGITRLKQNNFQIIRAYFRDPLFFQQKIKYFYDATHFLTVHHFNSKTEKQVWELHAEGKGIRHIAGVLSSQGIKTNKDQVAKILKDLRALMEHEQNGPDNTSWDDPQ